jgi:hypothetical protein
MKVALLSKMNFRHPKWQPVAILKKTESQVDLKWREMQIKINFRHPKWPPAAILKKYQS